MGRAAIARSICCAPGQPPPWSARRNLPPTSAADGRLCPPCLLPCSVPWPRNLLSAAPPLRGAPGTKLSLRVPLRRAKLAGVPCRRSPTKASRNWEWESAPRAVVCSLICSECTSAEIVRCSGLTRQLSVTVFRVSPPQSQCPSFISGSLLVTNFSLEQSTMCHMFGGSPFLTSAP